MQTSNNSQGFQLLYAEDDYDIVSEFSSIEILEDTFDHLANRSQNTNSSKEDKFFDNEDEVENEENFEPLYPVVSEMIFENWKKLDKYIVLLLYLIYQVYHKILTNKILIESQF